MSEMGAWPLCMICGEKGKFILTADRTREGTVMQRVYVWACTDEHMSEILRERL